MKRGIIVLFIVAAIGAGAGAYYIRRNGGEPQVSTAQITRGEIIDTVGSTGTLQAVTTVQVGSQVSGNIAWLGADFNSIVKKGQVIARIDPSVFQAQVEQAKANFTKAQADVEHNRVALNDANTKYTRAKELAAKSLIAQSDLDTAKTAVDAAQAEVQSSQAQVVQAQASLNQNQVNLDHCIITAPIDGIVIQRSVDVGQTVAASLQSPTLFIIAADLTKMQVNANIDEADVGRIRPGQHVTFRVDAYVGEDFQGTVAQIRLQPVVVQNVTTYGTIVDVPNPDLKLKPGMTANLRVQIARRPDVLRVPNTALRFRPTNDMFAALNQQPPPEAQFAGRGGRGNLGPGGQLRPPAGAGTGSSTGGAPSTPATPGTPGATGGTTPAGSTQPRLGSGTPGPGQAGRGGNDSDRAARMMDRLKSMSPDEQKQFIARMKERGIDTTPFENAVPKDTKESKSKSTAAKPGAAAKSGAATQSATSIDALFAPLPSVESQGRVWLYINKQLKPVRLRLGITDGTNTELLSGELQQGQDVVTGIVLTGTPRTSTNGSGNPLLQQGGRGPGGFGGGGFGGGGRGR